MVNFLNRLKRQNLTFCTLKLAEIIHSFRSYAANTFLLGSLGTVLITFLSYFVLPFNKWNSYFTPDSEFYLSLTIFGNDLVEKVINPAYYWTKSGQIIPDHLLASVFGWETGIQITQFIKLLIISFSSFVIFYLTKRNALTALIFVSFFTLNGTILTMLGNTYVTASVLSILTLFYLILKIYVDTYHAKGAKHFVSIVALWVILTFSIFVYPILTTNLGVIFLAFLLWLLFTQSITTQYIIRFSSLAIFTIGMTFFSSLFITKHVFPNQNWLATVKFYMKNLNASDYSNDSKYAVLFGDYALLVIVIGLILSIYIIIKRINFTQNTYCVAISQIALLLFALLQVEFLDSAILEASFLSAFFWIPSLLVTCLYFVEKIPRFNLNARFTLFYFIVMLVIFSVLRFWSDNFFRNTTHSLKINLFLIVLITCIVLFEERISFGNTVKFQLIFVFLIYSSFAHFQNSRELSNSAIGRIPYFSSSENRELSEANVHVLLEKELLSQIEKDEKSVVWTPPGSTLVTYAAMHFWGPNSISLGVELSNDEANYFKALRPRKLFAYVSKENDVNAFLKSLDSNGIQFSKLKTLQNYDLRGNVFYVTTYRLIFESP